MNQFEYDVNRRVVEKLAELKLPKMPKPPKPPKIKAPTAIANNAGTPSPFAQQTNVGASAISANMPTPTSAMNMAGATNRPY